MSDALATLRGVSAQTWSRFFSAGLASGTGAVLGAAVWLTPSPMGHGTHLQLGLGQCSFLTLSGYPCPMCGMTTTFTLLAHLHPLQALATQPFGLVLFAMTVAGFAISVAEVVQPRDRWTRIGAVLEPYESQLASVFLALMALGWVYKIVLMRFLGGG